jgi:hypothetical protein
MGNAKGVRRDISQRDRSAHILYLNVPVAACIRFWAVAWASTYPPIALSTEERSFGTKRKCISAVKVVAHFQRGKHVCFF